MNSKVTFSNSRNVVFCLLLAVMCLMFLAGTAAHAQNRPAVKSQDASDGSKRPEVQPLPQADVDPRKVPVVVFNTPRLNENANNFLRTRHLSRIATSAFTRQHFLVSGNTQLNQAWQGPRYTIGFVTDYEQVAEKNLASDRKNILARALGELAVEVANSTVNRLPGNNNPVLGPAKDKVREVTNEIGRDALDVMGLGRYGNQQVFATMSTLTRGDGSQYIPLQYGTLYLQVKRTAARLEGTSCFELNGVGTSPTNIVKLGGGDEPVRKFGCTADAVILGINEYMLTRFTERGGEIKAYLTGTRDARDSMPRKECIAENLNLETGKWECVQEATVMPKHQRRVRDASGQWVYVETPQPGQAEGGGSVQPPTTQAPPVVSIGGDIGGLGGVPASPPKPAAKPTPTPTPAPVPAPAPQIKPDPNAPQPNLGHTGRPAGVAQVFTRPLAAGAKGGEDVSRLVGFFCKWGLSRQWGTDEAGQPQAWQVRLGPVTTEALRVFQAESLAQPKTRANAVRFGLVADGKFEGGTLELFRSLYASLTPERREQVFPKMEDLLKVDPAPCRVRK